jgi:uncharacterized protein
MGREKNHFLIRLNPPRPSFQQDMTDLEKKLMQEHIVYWQKLLRKKIAFAFGPVFDPKGGYGIGIVEVDDEAAAKKIMDLDPTMLSKNGFTFEIYLMRLVKK